jgi:hypothetical protein
MSEQKNRSEEGYQNNSAALKDPKNTVASIILKWKKFGTTETLPIEQEKGFGQGGDQEPDGHSDRALKFLCGDRWENLPEGQPSLQHSTNQGFMVEWPDRSHSSVRGK